MSEVRRATLHLRVLEEVRKVGVEVAGEGVTVGGGVVAKAGAGDPGWGGGGGGGEE